MSKGRVYFRIVLGVYLAYLGFDLVRDTLADRPENYILFVVAGVLFMVFGVAWAGRAIKKAVNHEYEEEE